MRELRICSRCVMDTTDPGIEFDKNGICNRCRHYELHAKRELQQPKLAEEALKELVENIRMDGRNKDYDCVIGVSGGLDSTYVAYLAHQLGLRPLAVHLDNGWDSNIAVSNIETILRTLSIDLYTHVLNWDEFKDLQIAFLKGSTPDCEIPSDHAIFALLYHQAAKVGVKYILFGNNTTTEGIAVPDWSTGHYDWRYIKDVHRRFGSRPLLSYLHLSLLRMFWFRYVLRIRKVPILNLITYEKNLAESTAKSLGWRSYPGKHHESIYTRFYQSYILPKKFNADKRKIHLSTLIMSGQISREEALEQLKLTIAPEAEVDRDKEYVCKKLGLSIEEFDQLMRQPKRSFWDYRSYEKSLALKAYRIFRPARNPQPRKTR